MYGDDGVSAASGHDGTALVIAHAHEERAAKGLPRVSDEEALVWSGARGTGLGTALGTFTAIALPPPADQTKESEVGVVPSLNPEKTPAPLKTRADGNPITSPAIGPDGVPIMRRPGR